MSYHGFYRNIVKRGDKYWVRKGDEYFVDCYTLAEALYERDRLMGVNWDWNLYLNLPQTPNNYIHIDLPPFHPQTASYITHINEYWTVLSKGANPKYYGCYHSKEEAEKVRRIYNGRMSHRKAVWRVQRKIKGKNRHFGRYNTKEEAEERVRQLNENGWDIDDYITE